MPIEKHESDGACNAECEVYSRVTGYHRPIKNWNGGKRAEFSDRKTYRVNISPKIPTEAELEELKGFVKQMIATA